MRLLELAVGTSFVLLWIREWRRRKRHSHGQDGPHEIPDWLDLAGAGIFGLEAVHLWHRHQLTEFATGIHRLQYLPWS